VQLVAASALGIAGAAAGSRILESILYGVHSNDLAVIAAAPIILGAVALLACAVRAARLE
jgi:uncharacterized membrane protein YeaQ/YmgE (transglycosylase-associated protein family)